jgi:hypothetical protein
MPSLNASRAVRALVALSAMALLVGSAALPAQIRGIDPNSAIDADLVPLHEQAQSTQAAATQAVPVPAPPAAPANEPPPAIPNADTGNFNRSTAAAKFASYEKDDLIGAAQGVFGKGAEGLAGIIEKILKDQGQPNAYIAGREASGAVVVGLRYGSGTLFHKVEGERKIYWTGPSIGFDLGANASKSFVLIYNLYDGQDLFRRFPQAEGTAYLVGGFTASYLRRGNVVLIPIRLGVGWRLGVNAGYMNFTQKAKWLPF